MSQLVIFVRTSLYDTIRYARLVPAVHMCLYAKNNTNGTIIAVLIPATHHLLCATPPVPEYFANTSPFVVVLCEQDMRGKKPLLNTYHFASSNSCLVNRGSSAASQMTQVVFDYPSVSIIIP